MVFSLSLIFSKKNIALLDSISGQWEGQESDICFFTGLAYNKDLSCKMFFGSDSEYRYWLSVTGEQSSQLFLRFLHLGPVF